MWIALVVFSIFAGVGGWLYAYLSPGFATVEMHTDYQLVLGAQHLDDSIFVQDEEVLVPVGAVQKYLDSSLFWEPREGRLTITTGDRVLQMNTDELTAYMNRQEVQLNLPVRSVDGTPYLPLVYLQDFYGIDLQIFEDTRTVVIDFLETPYMEAAVERRVTLRTGPSLRTPRVAVLEPGEKVRVFREDGGWYHLRTSDGRMGYAHKVFLRITGAEVVQGPDSSAPRKWPRRPKGERVNLVWEHVVRENPSPDSLEPLPGVNVLSPTWFSLRDEEGNLHNKACPTYVQWAHEQGYQVWALVSNSFDRDLSASVLRDSRKREKVIDQLLAFSALYNLDGINVDFENMYLEDGDYFTQFMRELAPLAREQGLVLSVDVTIISSSVHWSMIYQRRALAETVDYVMLMAYDEHWGSSPVAGSVASLPWVERGLQGVLEEVPPEKLLLGVPFYTRLWEIELLENGEEQVSSRALGMDALQAILAEQGAEITFCPETKQNFARYESEEKEYRVWIEDVDSLSRRLQLVEKYNLAGVAAWRRGFESKEVWELFQEILTP